MPPEVPANQGQHGQRDDDRSENDEAGRVICLGERADRLSLSAGAYEAAAGAGSVASARRERTSNEAPAPTSSARQPVRKIRWSPLTKATSATRPSLGFPAAARSPEDATAADTAFP